MCCALPTYLVAWPVFLQACTTLYLFQYPGVSVFFLFFKFLSVLAFVFLFIFLAFFSFFFSFSFRDFHATQI